MFLWASAKSAQDKADEYTVDGKFVAIAGYEWTTQAKYETDVGPNELSERLFPGPPKSFNHKNVYFPVLLFRRATCWYPGSVRR